MSQIVVVGRHQNTTEFNRHDRPVATVQPGGRLAVETNCSAGGRITRPIVGDAAFEDAFRLGMPVGGPVHVAGAEPGDVLVVDILAIDLDSLGWSAVGPNWGLLGHRFSRPEARTFQAGAGHIDLEKRVRLSVKPMIGSIGTAPAGEGRSSLFPGTHGGNLDCALIGAGTRVLLPVFVPGAGLAVGDLHAAMGDGEVAGGGLEIGGRVTMQIAVSRGLRLPLPMVATPGVVATLASAETLDAAARLASDNMVDLLLVHGGLSALDAATLLSFAGDLRICQAVNDIVTCRMELGTDLVGQLGMDLVDLLRKHAV